MTLGTAAQNINTYGTKITSMEQTLDGFKWSVQAASSNNAWPDPYFIGIASKQSMWSGHVEYRGWETNPYQTFMYMWGRDHFAYGYPIPVTAGNTYRIKCNWIRGSGSLSLRAGLWGGKQTSDGDIDWEDGYNLGYRELIAQDAIGDWNTGYTEVTIPSQYNTACLFFQIEQGTEDTGTTFYVTNVTVTDTTQSQLISQHMTFDSTGLRVYGNDINKSVLINDDGVLISSAQNSSGNRGWTEVVSNGMRLGYRNGDNYINCGQVSVGSLTFVGETTQRFTDGCWLKSGDTTNSGVGIEDAKNKIVILHYSNAQKQLHLNSVGYIGLQKVKARGKDDKFNCVYYLKTYTYEPSFGHWKHELVYEIDARAKTLSFSCGILYSS